jgi:hypothetical protein
MIHKDPMESLKRGAKIGLIFGTSLFLFMFGVGTTIFVEDHIFAKIGPQQTIEVMIGVTVPLWCGWIAGNNFFFAPHVASGKEAAKRVFKFLEQKTEREVQ